MDSFNLWFWIALAAAGYAFMPSVRKEVNGWVVRLADKLRDNEHAKSKGQDLHLLEDVAFRMFTEDHPDSKSLAGGWNNLPLEIRSKYIRRAVELVIDLEKNSTV